MHNREHKGWHSRGYLPHFDQAGETQSVTFRLCDSVPRETIDFWKWQLGWHNRMASSDEACSELRRRIDEYEDQGCGTCWLRNRAVADLVENALLHFDSERYRLIAWCVMPNHVHAMVETLEGFPLHRILHSWKSFTAHQANKMLRREGEFWMEEYHDRFVRDLKHLRRAIEYIERNPVKARLARTPEEWEFSSARRREGL